MKRIGKKQIKKNVKHANSKKKLFYIFLITLFCICVCIVLGMNAQSIKTAFTSTLPQKSPTPNQATSRLTTLEIEELRKSLITLVYSHDPQTALQTLQAKLLNDSIANQCHSLTHSIGHAAYDKYKDVSKALIYTNEMCGSGYIHGVIEERFATLTDLNTEVQKICVPDNHGICFHGIGHGFMYFTNNDLTLSLSFCDNLSSDYQRNNCYDGVFMENFEGDQINHPTRYLNPDNPTFPCNQMKNKYKESCYFYDVRYYLLLHSRAYVSAFSWCHTLEQEYILTCFKGVGSALMKQNLNEPEFTDALCSKTQTEREKAVCIDGMVSYYLTNYFSVKKGISMCTGLSLNKEDCLAAVNIRKSLFPE